jgi:hypothetical protein
LGVRLVVSVGNNQDVVGAVGVEPTTNGLKGRCSTTELRPYCWALLLFFSYV